MARLSPSPVELRLQRGKEMGQTVFKKTPGADYREIIFGNREEQGSIREEQGKIREIRATTFREAIHRPPLAMVGLDS
jgi:hypothetical protein